MSAPPPGSLVDEAVKFAEALLHRVREESAPDLSPELVTRLAGAVAEVAVAGAGLLQVVAEVAQEWGRQATEKLTDVPDGVSPVERIDIS